MPSEVRFADVRRMLESCGYRHVRTSGSNHIFDKAGEPHHVSIPVHHGKVKAVYVRKVQDIVRRSQESP
ncbi:MAG: type II toxin-antitoxin system HicA family toxin [Tepidisphaeraceae bacterium]